MKLSITIEIPDVSDNPRAPRINHALAGLLYHALEKDLGGIYRFEYPADPWDAIPARTAVVTVVNEG